MKVVQAEKPLVGPWLVEGESPIPVRRSDGRFFRLTNVDVTTNTREVAQWSQPMLEESESSTVSGISKSLTGFVALFRGLMKEGSLYLVQAKAEPGSDSEGRVLLAPTLQASVSNMSKHGSKIPFIADFKPEKAKMAVQSKDGGRFYNKNNLLALQDFTEEEAGKLVAPENFIWATREEIRGLQMKGLANEHLNEVLGVFL